MKKIILVSLIMIWGLLSTGCNSSTGPESTVPFPEEFPLTVGNAWIYENTYYNNGVLDESQTFLDTLYIHGMYQDSYLYSWDNEDGYSAIIKQEDNKVYKIGAKYFNEVNIYDTPVFWSFNTSTGSFVCDDLNDQGFLCQFDSLFIETARDIEFAGKKYDTFIQAEYTEAGFLKYKRYFTADGYSKWEYYNSSGEVIRVLKQIKVLKDFFPQKNDNL